MANPGNTYVWPNGTPTRLPPGYGPWCYVTERFTIKSNADLQPIARIEILTEDYRRILAGIQPIEKNACYPYSQPWGGVFDRVSVSTVQLGSKGPSMTSPPPPLDFQLRFGVGSNPFQVYRGLATFTKPEQWQQGQFLVQFGSLMTAFVELWARVDSVNPNDNYEAKFSIMLDHSPSALVVATTNSIVVTTGGIAPI